MKAFVQKAWGSTSVLEEANISAPTASGRDILVRVKAVSVNPVDYKKRSNWGQGGEFKEAQPLIVGWDAAGIVESVGSDVTNFKVGDEVYFAGDLTRQGCNSELTVVDERIVAKKPTNLTFSQAAAIPLTALTAWEAMVEHLGIPVAADGATNPASILIINGAGGVGSIATQIAKRVLKLETVIATASREETSKFCRDHGADFIINHRNPLAEELKKIGHAEVDYVFCCYDTEPYFDQFADITKPLGKITSIVGSHSPLNVGNLFFKGLSFSWTFMFTKSMFKTHMCSQHSILAHVGRLVESGVLVSHMTQDMPLNLTNLRQAQDSVESGKAHGKIVLHWE